MIERTELDECVISGTWYDISNALTAMQSICGAFRGLHLGESLTKEQKYKIRHDLEFSHRAVQYLQRAKTCYQDCIKALEQVLAEFDQRVDAKNYDMQQANAYEILAVKYMYRAKTNHNPEVMAEVHKFLLDVGGPADEEFTVIYKALMAKSRAMSESQKS